MTQNTKPFVLIYNDDTLNIVYKTDEPLSNGQMTYFIPSGNIYVEFDTEEEMSNFINENNLIEPKPSDIQ